MADAAELPPFSEGGCEVYINGLPAETTEEDLAAAFESYGEIVKTRLRRRARTGGVFGFVLYTDGGAAQAAIDAKNGQPFFEGAAEALEVALAREPRVRPPRRPRRALGDESKVQLFCANLPWETDDEQLRAIFVGKGDLEECAVVKRPDGRSRGFGFVKFVNEADAAAALKDLEGHLIGAGTDSERELRLQPARELMPAVEGEPAAPRRAKKERKRRTPRQKVDPATTPNQVYCSNLPADFKASHLKHIFEETYNVVGRPFISRRKRDRPRYGFIALSSQEEVTKAIEDLNDAEFASGEDGEAGASWQLKCERARPRTERPNAAAAGKPRQARKPRARKPRPDNTSRRVFCKGFPESFAREDLSGLFHDHGEVERVRLRKKNRRNGPFAHLVFKTDDQAQAAVAELNGHNFGEQDSEGNDCILVVEMSRPRRTAAGAEAAPAEPSTE